jgi:hypothetical protein
LHEAKVQYTKALREAEVRNEQLAFNIQNRILPKHLRGADKAPNAGVSETEKNPPTNQTKPDAKKENKLPPAVGAANTTVADETKEDQHPPKPQTNTTATE